MATLMWVCIGCGIEFKGHQNQSGEVVADNKLAHEPDVKHECVCATCAEGE